MRFWKLVYRACRLRCPLCGAGGMFRNYVRMNKECPQCGVKFEREGGFFLGSIYFNYGLTTLMIVPVYIVLMFSNFNETLGLSEETFEWVLNGGTLAFAVLFPLWFYRYARSLWAGFDQFCDPREDIAEK